MEKIDLEILNDLTEDDIKILSKKMDMNKMLQPIKQNSKYYSKYVAQLGRMDNKSKLVQKNMSRIAFELYKRGDQNYYKVFAKEMLRLEKKFTSIICECMGQDAVPEDIRKYSLADFKKLFRKLIEKGYSSLDFGLFYLQTRLFGIEIEDNVKIQIEMEWEHIQELVNAEKEFLLINIQEIKLREQDFNEKVRMLKEDYSDQLFKLNSKLQKLREENSDIQQTITYITKKNEDYEDVIKNNNNQLLEKDNKIIKLNNQVNFFCLEVEKLTSMLQQRNKGLYDDIQNLWEEENQEKIKIVKELGKKKLFYENEINELSKKKNDIKNIILEWEGCINTYLQNMGEKSIEQKIESVLLEKGFMVNHADEIAVTKELSNNVCDLYIQKGYKVYDELKCYEDYEKLSEIAEENLINIGVQRNKRALNDCFESAMGAGVSPLICGYAAREVALALVAAKFGEHPEIISVPAGYGNVNELARHIKDVETKTIIIEDIFGKMNEGVILPILKNFSNKIIILTAEGVKELKYLQSYFYNYVQLLVTTECKKVNKYSLIYAKSDELVKNNYNSEAIAGDKMAKQILQFIGMDSAYVSTRARVFEELLDEKKDNSEEKALQKLIITELKWIVSKEQKGRLLDLFESNSEKYSQTLRDCVE
jgi:hypothetical protein